MREISPADLQTRLAAGEPTYLLDVRQAWEHQLAALPRSVLVPLDELPGRLDDLAPPAGALVVTICHHGVRSVSAAALLGQAGLAPVASLAGGIDAWSRLVDPAVPRY